MPPFGRIIDGHAAGIGRAGQERRALRKQCKCVTYADVGIMHIMPTP